FDRRAPPPSAPLLALLLRNPPLLDRFPPALPRTPSAAHCRYQFPLPWRVLWAALQWASYCRDDPHSSGYSASSIYLSEHNCPGWRYADSALGECYRSLTNVQLPSWSHAPKGAYAPMEKGL